MSERVRIGRVGRPHGIDGAFFVEQPSDDKRWWKTGATFFAVSPADFKGLLERPAGG